MSVATNLYEKIETKGALDAERILAAAREKAAATMKSERATAETEAAARIRAAERIASDRVKAVRTDAVQLAKKATLEIRKAVIDGVFADAAKALDQLSDAAYADLVVTLLKNDGLTGSETIHVSAKDHARFQSLFSSTADGTLDILAKRLKQPKFRLMLAAEPAAIAGGFVVVGTHYDVDHAWTTILSDLRDGTEPELADILFSEGA